MAGRVVWTAIVAAFVAVAVAAVVTIVRENTASASGEAEGAADAVVMEKLTFAPDVLAVARGAEVTFTNDDVAPHTVTADDGSVDSGLLNPGQAFVLVVNEPFTYHCALHPSMTAEIQLEG